MVIFGCPSCKKKFQVADEAAGKRIKCPKCREPITVPKKTDETVVTKDTITGRPPAKVTPAKSPKKTMLAKGNSDHGGEERDHGGEEREKRGAKKQAQQQDAKGNGKRSQVTRKISKPAKKNRTLVMPAILAGGGLVFMLLAGCVGSWFVWSWNRGEKALTVQNPNALKDPQADPNAKANLEEKKTTPPDQVTPPPLGEKLPPVRLDKDFKDGPTNVLAVDPGQPTSSACFDLSKGMQAAHTFKFRDNIWPTLSANGNVIVGSTPSEFLSIDLMSRQIKFKIPRDKQSMLAITRDGSKLAVLDDDSKKISIRDFATGKELKQFDSPMPPENLHFCFFSPGGRYVIVGLTRDYLQIWDSLTGKRVRQLEMRARNAAISMDGKHLLVNDFKAVSLYDFASMKLIRAFNPPFDFFEAATFSPDGNLILNQA